jgi:hypothetical protein
MLDGGLLAPAGSGSERRGGGWARRPSDMSVALSRADGPLLLVVMQAVPLKKAMQLGLFKDRCPLQPPQNLEHGWRLRVPTPVIVYFAKKPLKFVESTRGPTPSHPAAL